MTTNPLTRKIGPRSEGLDPMTTPSCATPKPPTAKPVATKPAHTNRGAAILKTTLVASSIVATVLGASLIARQDQAATAPVAIISTATLATVRVPQPLATVPNLSVVPDPNEAAIDNLLNQQLVPVPTLVSPPVSMPTVLMAAPVARSRSSR